MPGSLFQAYPDRDACVRGLAGDLHACLQRALAADGRARMLMPGGSSPQALFPLLAAQALDWGRVDTTPGDERWVDREDERSNFRLLREGLPQACCLDPRLADTAEESARLWGERMREWLPFSVVLLGVGGDGHFASLFPGMPGLDQALDLQAAPDALVGHAPDEPRLRISANLAMLLDSDWVGLLVFGEDKKRLIYAALAHQQASLSQPIHALLHNGIRPVHIHWAP
ncbi:6-phosphogluconolactonase [Pseudomonas mangrovi]|nr:6-phosphogluconolactonase [Pseudomonas mangrovi]